jgi:hypothetical protein
MAHITKDRVKQTTQTTGTGTYTFDAAIPQGYVDFLTAIGAANTCYYCATAGNSWEVGLGTVSGNTLARTVIRSSNADALVVWGTGVKDVFNVAPADVLGMLRVSGTNQSIVITGGANTITLAPATGSTIQGGLTVTGTTALPAGTTAGGSVVVVSTRQVLAGAGLTGGGDLSADRTLLLDTGSSRNVDHSAVSVIAGTGLTGGGTIAADRTLNVGAGDGISVAADAVAVDATVVRTTGNQTIAGIKTFSSSPVVPTPVAGTDAANKTYVDSGASGTYGGYVDSNALAEVLPASWTAVRNSLGNYTVSFPALASANYAVVCNQENTATPSRINASITARSTTAFTVVWWSHTDGAYADVNFLFILKLI